jgi:8-oxo-dGTP pyrophosphatase MutT (NUDIX family)
MKKITAAIVIINPRGDILGCHGTGKPHNMGFDFPKGLVEPDETDMEAALRELREETSLVLDDDQLIDCGVYPHNKEKNIHIFVHKTDILPEPESLVCQSFFTLNDKEYPECDFFEIIPREDRNKFNKVLWNKFEIIDKFNI